MTQQLGPPENLNMFWCNMCGTFKPFNPFKHYDKTTGRVCTGEIRKIGYGRTYGQRLPENTLHASGS